MNVGLAEKLVATDPEAAAELLREARETTCPRSRTCARWSRGIHPPVLADRGLAGGIEALALPIPMPVTLIARLSPGTLPAAVESAVYFAVAECLTNVVKHAGADRAWVDSTHDGTACCGSSSAMTGAAAPTRRRSGLAGVRSAARGLRRHNERSSAPSAGRPS